MPDEIISMADMNAIFLITDQMGIHRESVRVELAKEDPGSIGNGPGGIVEITVPETGPIQEFTARLQSELEAMGYEFQELDDDFDEDE